MDADPDQSMSASSVLAASCSIPPIGLQPSRSSSLLRVAQFIPAHHRANKCGQAERMRYRWSSCFKLLRMCRIGRQRERERRWHPRILTQFPWLTPRQKAVTKVNIQQVHSDFQFPSQQYTRLLCPTYRLCPTLSIKVQSFSFFILLHYWGYVLVIVSLTEVSATDYRTVNVFSMCTLPRNFAISIYKIVLEVFAYSCNRPWIPA